MIEAALFVMVRELLGALLALLPTWKMPPGVSLSLLSAADFVLPLSELVLAVGVLSSFAVASLGYAGIMKVVKLLRGGG